jgi:hypothetical protein
LSYITTAEMLADCFRKPLPKAAVLTQCAAMGMIGSGLRNGLGNGLGNGLRNGLGFRNMNGLGNGFNILGNGHRNGIRTGNVIGNAVGKQID